MTAGEKSVLYRCSLFSGMTARETDQLLHCLGAREAAYEKNEMVWAMGDTVPSCALVLSGQLRAETVDDSGGRTVTVVHGPGHLVGDILMATPEGRSPVYVIAARRSRLLLLPYSAMVGGCEKNCPCHTRLRQNLLAELARKYWLQRQRLSCLTASSLRRKIAMYLLDTAAGRESFSIGIRREDMADYLGVNRSAMSRELCRMRDDGLFTFRRDAFTLTNLTALEKLAK